jgi:hypothetical protein
MAPIPERGYPLSALFLLMAACAIPMSMAAAAGRAISQGDVGADDMALAALLGCTGTMMLGMIIGLHHYRPLLGAIVGGLAGALIGSMAGPVVLAPRQDFPKLMLVSVVGSAAMVAVAAWLRFSAQRRNPPQPPTWLDEGNPFRQGEANQEQMEKSKLQSAN